MVGFFVGQKLAAAELDDFNPAGDVNPGDDIALGSGGVVTWSGDTNLYRASANVLQTDDTLKAPSFQATSAISASITEATGGSTTSTSYVAVGATCGFSFVAPASGRVTILYDTAGFNSGSNDNKTTVEVRAGSTVGSGTVFTAASDNNMILFSGASTYRKGVHLTVTGLTAGSTYNVQMLHKTSAGTATVLFRGITVTLQL